MIDCDSPTWCKEVSFSLQGIDWLVANSKVCRLYALLSMSTQQQVVKHALCILSVHYCAHCLLHFFSSMVLSIFKSMRSRYLSIAVHKFNILSYFSWMVVMRVFFFLQSSSDQIPAYIHFKSLFAHIYLLKKKKIKNKKKKLLLYLVKMPPLVLKF